MKRAWVSLRRALRRRVIRGNGAVARAPRMPGEGVKPGIVLETGNLLVSGRNGRPACRLLTTLRAVIFFPRGVGGFMTRLDEVGLGRHAYIIWPRWILISSSGCGSVALFLSGERLDSLRILGVVLLRLLLFLPTPSHGPQVASRGALYKSWLPASWWWWVMNIDVLTRTHQTSIQGGS